MNKEEIIKNMKQMKTNENNREKSDRQIPLCIFAIFYEIATQKVIGP